MGLLTAIAAPVGMSAEPAPAAAAAFDRYAASVESRLARQHQSQNGFIAALPDAPSRMRLRQGEVVVERITPVADANPPERCCTTGAARPSFPERMPGILSG